MQATRMKLYSFERENWGLSNKPKIEWIESLDCE